MPHLATVVALARKAPILGLLRPILLRHVALALGGRLGSALLWLLHRLFAVLLGQFGLLSVQHCILQCAWVTLENFPLNVGIESTHELDSSNAVYNLRAAECQPPEAGREVVNRVGTLLTFEQTVDIAKVQILGHNCTNQRLGELLPS